MAKIDLRRTVIVNGVSYGPGKDIEVPDNVARSLGKLSEDSSTKTKSAATKTAKKG